MGGPLRVIPWAVTVSLPLSLLLKKALGRAGSYTDVMSAAVSAPCYSEWSFPNLSAVLPCQWLMRTRMLPLPKIGGSPPPSAPRPSLDSSNHNKSPPCYCPLTPDLPEYTEHICVALHTTVLQISGDPTPPLPSLDKINTSSPSAMPQSLWLPGPLPSKELFLSPHPSGLRAQHKDSPNGLTSTSLLGSLRP